MEGLLRTGPLSEGTGTPVACRSGFSPTRNAKLARRINRPRDSLMGRCADRIDTRELRELEGRGASIERRDDPEACPEHAFTSSASSVTSHRATMADWGDWAALHGPAIRCVVVDLVEAMAHTLRGFGQLRPPTIQSLVPDVIRNRRDQADASKARRNADPPSVPGSVADRPSV